MYNFIFQLDGSATPGRLGMGLLLYAFHDADGNFTKDMGLWDEVAGSDRNDPCLFTVEEMLDILSTERFARVTYEDEFCQVTVVTIKHSNDKAETGYV